MFGNFIENILADKSNPLIKNGLIREKDVSAKTTLLSEGEISQYLYYIKKGCLRLWFNNDGRDITFQFFFEGQAVSSFESFFEKQPGIMNIESIEQCELVLISRTGFDELLLLHPEINDKLLALLMKRMGNYAKLFLSRIKDNPEKRYKELLNTNPEIIKRIPQHYIASYLGITPISLSRIRNRISSR
jgi:CRP-like cAMP-binding protein